MKVTVLPSRLKGRITAPPSKSTAHRAVIAAALAKGTSVIENVALSDDILATVGACRALGCDINAEQRGRYYTLTVKGGAGSVCGADIDCRESGSTLRFLLPVACAAEGRKTFHGQGRLPERPIGEYLRIFDEQGISYEKPYDNNLPLAVSGRLSGGEYNVRGDISSQYITGLLFALPLLKTDSVIRVEGELQSAGYAEMTLDTLRRFGIEAERINGGFAVKGNQEYVPQNLAVEGDYSQAAFFMAGGALSGDVAVEGLHESSLQPDRMMIEFLRRMGADIEWEGSALRIRESSLKGITADVSQCPDIAPPLAAVAAYASGEMRITGAERLRIKESDRIKALADNLSRVGIAVRELPAELVISGGTIEPGEADAMGDHRIAMAFAVAALKSKEGITIEGAQSVSKSYPQFFEDIASLGGKLK